MAGRPKQTILAVVGRYAKGVDPDMVARMKREGYRTDDASVGRYVKDVHPSQFDSIVEELRSEGAIRNPRQPEQVAWVAKYPQHHFDRLKPTSDEVRTHYNLNSGGYTIDVRTPVGWRLRDDQTQAVTLRGAHFEYQPSGHRRYSEGPDAGRRNVHAWVYGKEDYAPVDVSQWRPCRYSKDPPCFVDIETRQCLPNDRSIDVHLASRSNIDPATGKARKSMYARGRAVPWAPVAYWRPAAQRNPHNLVVNPYKEKILLPSGNVQYVYSEQDIAKRHAEKAQRIEQLKTKEQRLRSAVKQGTEAGDPVATAVAMIMATYERVGNNESAAEGHFGVTGWQARHFTREGSKYRIDYVGKSGVEQTKVIDQPWLVQALAQHLRKKRKNERVLPVSASTVNRYLEEYDVSAKDLRGYGANTEMQRELTRARKKGPALATLKPKDVIKTLKAEFNAALAVVAAKLGHTTSVLRKQYLVQDMEPLYTESGAVLRSFA
jgi:Eukaryotic DNA topoisomerase I, catalytic core